MFEQNGGICKFLAEFLFAFRILLESQQASRKNTSNKKKTRLNGEKHVFHTKFKLGSRRGKG